MESISFVRTSDNDQDSQSNLIPTVVVEYLFLFFNYSSLIACRRVCREWNFIITDKYLANKTIFHILPNPACKYWKSQLKRKSSLALIPDLSVSWTNIHIHNLSDSISLWNSSSFYLNYDSVTHLTLYDGSFTFKQLVSKMFAKMTAVKHFRLCQAYFTGKFLHFRFDMVTPFKKLYTRTASWRKGIATLQKLETFRIGIQSWISTIVYMQLLTLTKIGSLRRIDLDFSKLFGLPFSPLRIEETYNHVANLVSANGNSLTEFQLRWTHRVETDTDISRYEDEHDYFLYFVDMLGSPNWPGPEIMQLLTFELNFPRVNFDSPMVNLVLIPYLRRQLLLQRFFLSRVQISQSFYRFNMRFVHNENLRREFGISTRDIDPTIATIPLNPSIRRLEVHILWSVVFQLTNPALPRYPYYNSSGKFCVPHVKSLKLYNSKLNSLFLSFNPVELITSFPNLQQLELLDECFGDRPTVAVLWPSLFGNKSQLGDSELLLIVKHLPRLVSLKLSSLEKLTDAGLTGIHPNVIARMNNTGNYFTTEKEVRSIPLLSKMKCLKFLELRNLTNQVTDISVFFGFQYIPKLEKIAFHGHHKITTWGTKALENQFRNNPRFAIFLKKFPYMPFYNDFP